MTFLLYVLVVFIIRIKEPFNLSKPYSAGLILMAPAPIRNLGSLFPLEPNVK